MTALASVLDELAEKIAEIVVMRLRGPHKQPTRLLTVKETAERIGRSPDAVRLLINRKRMPAIKAGGRIHVKEADLERWVEQHRVA